MQNEHRLFLLFQDKWQGVLYHVQGIREWYQGECDHSESTEPCTNQQGAKPENFNPIDADFKLFRSIIIDKRWMKSLQYYAYFRYRIDDKSLISFIACF